MYFFSFTDGGLTCFIIEAKHIRTTYVHLESKSSVVLPLFFVTISPDCVSSVRQVLKIGSSDFNVDPSEKGLYYTYISSSLF